LILIPTPTPMVDLEKPRDGDGRLFFRECFPFLGRG